MRHFTMNPTGDDAVTLTGYLQDRSQTFPNLERRPAVVVLPGGGYEFCSDREAEPVALKFAAAGYHAFVLRYSTGAANSWPAPLVDAEAALRAISAHAEDWGVAAEQVAVIGFSAGGHLAASVSLLGTLRPAATMLIYPVTTRQTLQVCNPATWQAPDLLEAITADSPPTFLAHSAVDQTVPVTDSLSYASGLAAAQVPFELHIFPTGKHGISLGTALTSSGLPENADEAFAGWSQLAIAWLGRQFPIG